MIYKQPDSAKDYRVWNEYVNVQALTLDLSTIKRAREAGIGKSLVELSRDVLAAVQQL
jgi:hypothetical protein